MSNAATHLGTCQVCGREQALPSGILSKHGYEVAGFGYFHGVCFGAGHLPLEQDRKIADNVAADLRRSAALDLQHVAWLRDKTENPTRANSGRRVLVRNRWEDERVAYAEAPAHEQDAERARLIVRHESEARSKFSYADRIEELADRVTHKVELRVRPAEAPRKVVKVGSVVIVWGSKRKVAAIEQRVVRGIGPSLNGHVVAHAVFEGGNFGYPVRLIKQASIVNE